MDENKVPLISTGYISADKIVSGSVWCEQRFDDTPVVEDTQGVPGKAIMWRVLVTVLLIVVVVAVVLIQPLVMFPPIVLFVIGLSVSALTQLTWSGLRFTDGGL